MRTISSLPSNINSMDQNSDQAVFQPGSKTPNAKTFFKGSGNERKKNKNIEMLIILRLQTKLISCSNKHALIYLIRN